MFKMITAPSEGITLASAAEFMRAEFSTSEQSLIESLITASRQQCEEYLFRRIGQQTVELRDQGFPVNGSPIILPAPLIEVISIKYLDENRIEQTLDEDDYAVSDSAPVLIVPVNAYWPAASKSGDSLRVRFTCGYNIGESPVLTEVLPQTIRTAMLMQVADMYENREAQSETPLSQNQTLERLLAPYRLEMGI